MKVRGKGARVAGVVLGAAVGTSAPVGAPALVGQAQARPFVSPGLVVAKHGGTAGSRTGIGAEVTAFDIDDVPVHGGFLQFEFFSDGSMRLGLGYQLFAPFVGVELGPSLHFEPETGFDAGFQIAPWLGIGYVNVAGRLIPRGQGFDYGGALTLKLPVDVDRGEVFNPLSAVIVDGRPVRDADGGCVRPGVAVVGRRRVPDAARRLPVGVRRSLGRAWLDAARDEHGSIAAFERLAAHLAARGAPPALVARARRSAADEDRHARRCFAIAGALLGLRLRPVSPVVPQSPAPSLTRLAVESLEDGEWNEGAAARLAALGAEAARFGPVRDTLGVIARDEAGHAQLAQAVRAWAESAAEPAERRQIRHALDAAHARRRPISPRYRAPRGAEAAWARWGRPVPAQVAAVERQMATR